MKMNPNYDVTHPHDVDHAKLKMNG